MGSRVDLTPTISAVRSTPTRPTPPLRLSASASKENLSHLDISHIPRFLPLAHFRPVQGPPLPRAVSHPRDPAPMHVIQHPLDALVVAYQVLGSGKHHDLNPRGEDSWDKVHGRRGGMEMQLGGDPAVAFHPGGLVCRGVQSGDDCGVLSNK